jgi:hypothetical protein
VEGVLVRLLADTTGHPSFWFGKVFSPVLPALDALRWHPTCQPWMGAPDHFDEEGDLWRRGSLSRYWRNLAEEYIELWGFPASSQPHISEQDAVAFLMYTDSTCWELYTSLPGVPERVFSFANGLHHVVAARARLDRRGEAFGFVGLSAFWRAMRGDA